MVGKVRTSTDTGFVNSIDLFCSLEKTFLLVKSSAEQLLFHGVQNIQRINLIKSLLIIK